MKHFLTPCRPVSFSVSTLAYGVNTLATGYGDFRTSVAKRRRRATEISVFAYGWMEEGVGFVVCYFLLLYNHNMSLEKVCRGP